MSQTPDQIRSELERGREKLEDLRKQHHARRQASERATPGGLTGYDPAILSGLSRRPNPRATDHRFDAYDREAAASRRVTEQEKVVAGLERRLGKAISDAKAPCELDKVTKGWLVRDRWGWHRVVRVNRKSVSVETPYTWTDRIALDRIIETRAPSNRSAAGATPAS